MSIKALDFVAQGNIQKAATNLAELVKEFANQGFVIGKPKGQPVVHRSKNDNLQMMLVNKNDTSQRVYVRISAALDAEMSTGGAVKLEECPVYVSEITNQETGKPTGAKMLTLGLNGPEVEIVTGGFTLSAKDFTAASVPAKA